MVFKISLKSAAEQIGKGMMNRPHSRIDIAGFGIL